MFFTLRYLANARYLSAHYARKEFVCQCKCWLNRWEHPTIEFKSMCRAFEISSKFQLIIFSVFRLPTRES